MSRITLSFMQRFMGNLDTAIKNYVKSKDATQKGNSISAGTDLDDLKTAGNYYVANDSVASNISNLPLALCGKVMVIDSGNSGLLQIYIPNHSSRLFQRVYWSSAWQSWDEYAKRGKRLSQTLTAGSTTVTFTSPLITANAFYDVYPKKAGLNYSEISEGTNTITITYEAQDSDVEIVLEIRD